MAAMTSASLPKNWFHLHEPVAAHNKDHGARTLRPGMLVRVSRDRIFFQPSKVEVRAHHTAMASLGLLGGHAYFLVERDELAGAL